MGTLREGEWCALACRASYWAIVLHAQIRHDFNELRRPFIDTFVHSRSAAVSALAYVGLGLLFVSNVAVSLAQLGSVQTAAPPVEFAQ